MATLISVEMLAPNIVLKLAKYNLNKNTFSSTFSWGNKYAKAYNYLVFKSHSNKFITSIPS